MTYRTEAESVTGFVQQLACAYLGNGYHSYVLGEIPDKKNPDEIDARFIDKFQLASSRWVRARRKKAGLANLHYIRFRRFFVLLATEGDHEFFKTHRKQIRRIVEKPIAFAGYSIGYHRGVDGKWHVSVRIHPERYRDIKARLLDIATKRSADEIAKEFRELRFEPYAPVRRQMFNMLRAVNRVRGTAGLEKVPNSVIRLKRRLVRPFGDAAPEVKAA
jgi:hypothetical protein